MDAFRQMGLALMLALAGCYEGVPATGSDQAPSVPEDWTQIDECALELDGCDPNAQCIDTHAYYECRCQEGFEGDGFECRDTDECAAGTSTCSEHATCTNVDGGYACACNDGFEGDGETCSTHYISLSASTSGTCGVRVDGALYCWGTNERGRLGLGHWIDAYYDRPFATGARNVAQVDLGVEHGCAVTSDGAVLCWGFNSHGQSGGVANTPTLVSEGRWVHVTVGTAHSCALDDDSELWCWGRNNRGQLGDDGPDTGTPRRVGAELWLAADAGGNRSCGVQADGTLWCWGNSEPMTRVGSDRDWLSVSRGQQNTCAIKADGSAWCFGQGDAGQLGTGTLEAAQEPVRVQGSEPWAQLSVGERHVCGVREDGSAWCWGDGNSSRLGGEPKSADTPRRVGSHNDWEIIAAGADHTCGTVSGQPHCWGSFRAGQLGIGVVANRQTPHRMAADATFDSITVAVGKTCALSDGTLWCVGSNSDYALGAELPALANELVRIGNRDDWREVSLGERHGCGIARGSELFCWGSNDEGQLGTASDGSASPVPLPVKTSRKWEHVDSGSNSTCAIDNNGGLWCWGAYPASSSTPVLVGDQDFASIAVGASHICAIETGGVLFCWGSGDLGQLGLGHTDDRDAPAQVGTQTDWARIAAGDRVSIGIRDDGSLWAWGTNLLVPTRISVGTQWFDASASGRTGCATRNNGTLWCWGEGARNGLSGFDPVDDPQRLQILGEYSTPRVGAEHACALRSDGALLCWGINTAGQLGPAWIGDPTPIIE